MDAASPSEPWHLGAPTCRPLGSSDLGRAGGRVCCLLSWFAAATGDRLLIQGWGPHSFLAPQVCLAKPGGGTGVNGQEDETGTPEPITVHNGGLSFILGFSRTPLLVSPSPSQLPMSPVLPTSF